MFDSSFTVFFYEYVFSIYLSKKNRLDDLSYLYIKYVLAMLLIDFLFSRINLVIVPILDE